MPDAYRLRDYQSQLLARVFECWGSGKQRLALQLATGVGKTIIFSAIAREFLRQGLGVLVLALRLELITQAHEKLEEAVCQRELSRRAFPCIRTTIFR